jgi:hypothetical protein
MKNVTAERGGRMKNLALCFLVLVIFTLPLYAETAATQQQTAETAAPDGQQMKCPMMQMHGQGSQQMPMMHGGEQMQGMMQMCPKMCPRMGQMMGHGMMARDMMQMMTDVIRMQQKIIRGLSPVEKKETMKDTERMLDRMEKMMSDMRGMMMHGMMEQPAPAPSKEPASKETEKEALPKADPHKH